MQGKDYSIQLVAFTQVSFKDAFWLARLVDRPYGFVNPSKQ